MQIGTIYLQLVRTPNVEMTTEMSLNQATIDKRENLEQVRDKHYCITSTSCANARYAYPYNHH